MVLAGLSLSSAWTIIQDYSDVGDRNLKRVKCHDHFSSLTAHRLKESYAHSGLKGWKNVTLLDGKNLKKVK